MDRDAIVPWSEARKRTPASLRMPPWLTAAVAAAVGAGPVAALASRTTPERRIVRGIFFASAFGYLVTSLVDFAEHFRMEKRLTGRWLASAAVPPGETLNHAATIATVVSSLALVQRPRRRPRLRDWWTLLAPGVFLALGWRDEFWYHRRRANHREDMMHTIPHLAAGIMWTSLYAMRLY